MRVFHFRSDEDGDGAGSGRDLRPITPTRCLKVVLALVVLGLSTAGWAAEFRLPTSFPVSKEANPPAPAPEATVPVDRALVEKGIQQVLSAWNKGDLDKHVSKELFDKTRLLDNIQTKVPRDAVIRLLGMQGVQTLGQRSKVDPKHPGRSLMVSTVSITAQTQINFNEPGRGYQRVEGTNEFILKITQEYNR